MKLGVRWTVGDVSPRGFDALALSIEAARNVFGDAAEYVVGVNTIAVATARSAVGSVASQVDWIDVSSEIPKWLDKYVESDLGGGMLWKLAPVRMFHDCHELSLDNDVILWRMPDSIAAWLEDGDSLLIAKDVAAHYGRLECLCGSEPRNAGIRGLPPGFDADARVRKLLAEAGLKLTHECDEQGLQVALVTREKHRVVDLDEVAICGYFRPHLMELGECGAHFVGVNSKKLPWSWEGRSGEEYVHYFWDCKKPEIVERIHGGANRISQTQCAGDRVRTP